LINWEIHVAMHMLVAN